MTDLSTLPEVLSYLHEIAPERCGPAFKHPERDYCLVYASGMPYYIPDPTSPNSPIAEAAAEYLVRELIEEAGWNWSLSRQGQKCTAILVKTLLHGPRSWMEFKAEAPTPLLALTNALRRAT